MLSLSGHTRNCSIGLTPTSGVTYFNELLHRRHINSKKNCSRNPTAHLPSRKRAEPEDSAEVHLLLPNPHLGGACQETFSQPLCPRLWSDRCLIPPPHPVGFPLVSGMAWGAGEAAEAVGPATWVCGHPGTGQSVSGWGAASGREAFSTVPHEAPSPHRNVKGNRGSPR